MNARALAINFSVIVVVVGGLGTAVLLMGRGNANDNASTPVVECASKGIQHKLQLSKDSFSQASLTVNHCDAILIENEDTLSYDLNFGEHDKHASYPGYDPATLAPHKSMTITAVKAGEFQLHDHFRDNAELQLKVL